MSESNDNELGYLPNELRTQDNAITADPLFIVEEEERVYGVGADYTDSFEEPEEGCGDRVGFVKRWRFVTACFTRRACEDYIKVNAHNLRSPRVYVASAHRNREWIALRKLLMEVDSSDAGMQRVTSELLKSFRRVLEAFHEKCSMGGINSHRRAVLSVDQLADAWKAVYAAEEGAS